MVSFRKRNNNPVRLFGRRLLFILLCIAIILMFPGVWKVYTQEVESRLLKRQAVQELSLLKEREKHVRDKTSALDTSRGLEEALREQFSLGEVGERMIVVVDRPQEEIQTESARVFWSLFNGIFR